MAEERKTAACLAVGSELLGIRRLDSNSLTISRTLARYGVHVQEKRVVGDSVNDIATAIGELVERHDLVVVTGGLGPTADDVTREAVAQALDREIAPDAETEKWIRNRYAELGRRMPEACTTMARVVSGSRPLRNTRGSAPGILVEHNGHLLAVFPGVPWEMEEMLERDLVPEISRWSPGSAKLSRTLVLGGMVESDCEELILHLYDRFGRENVTILASYGVLRLVLMAEGDKATALRQIETMEAAYREVLGEHIAGVDVAGLPEVALELLRNRGATLATAESCTGGLISAAFTDVPGASDVFVGGVATYSNDAKEDFLGVAHEMLVDHGAVSEEVARAMAEGACQKFDTDWGIGITGIAGPTGGTEEKPVGLVHWAVAGPEGTTARHRVFLGDRSIIRQWSVNAAIDHLRRRLLEGVG